MSVHPHRLNRRATYKEKKGRQLSSCRHLPGSLSTLLHANLLGPALRRLGLGNVNGQNPILAFAVEA
jgi:hypothetical protein